MILKAIDSAVRMNKFRVIFCSRIVQMFPQTFGRHNRAARDEAVRTILTTSGLRELMVIAAWQSILHAPFFSFSPFPGFVLADNSIGYIAARTRTKRRAKRSTLFYRDKYRSGFFRLRCIDAGQSVRNHTYRSK